MESICANPESNWSEMFTQLFNTINAPGCFPLNDGIPCPFCEDRNRIPVVMSNYLSTEIKKIPLQIICEEAGLFGSQVREILKSKVQTDYIVEQFYMDIFGKAFALKQGNYIHPKNSDTYAIPTQSSSYVLCDSRSSNASPKVKFPSIPYVEHKISRLAASPDYGNLHVLRINWNGTTRDDWWSIDCYSTSTTCFMPWPEIDKRLYLSEKDIKDINFARTQEKNESLILETNREVENICRIKDPYLVAVNAAIFSKETNNPQEGTEAYYKVAQEYALFGTTQQGIGNQCPTKDANEPKLNDCSKECVTQATPLQLNIRTPTTQTQKSSGPSVEFRNVPPPPGFSNSMNQVQQTIGGSNILQKPPTVPTQKYFPKVLSPQQIALQTAIQKQRQTGNYGVPNFAQSLPQSVLYSNTAVNPSYLNACYNETQINTSIIQQQQFKFYGTGAAYDMMIYAQMLQQTQTIVSKNRNMTRTGSDFQRSSFSPNPNTSLTPPSMNVLNQPQPTRQRTPTASDALLGFKIDDPLDGHLPFDPEPDNLDPSEKNSFRNQF